MRPPRLEDDAIASALDALNSRLDKAWRIEDGLLCKRFDFGDFVQAFGFMRAVADCAEALDHHPDWRNVYARVEFALQTHDAGGITALDFRLAQAIEDCWLRAS